MMGTDKRPGAHPCGLRALRSNHGFTFTEVMVALLIFVLLSAFVASGIPVAFKTYQRTVNASNAQIAVSTTAAALRDELGLATAVEIGSDNKVEYYQSPDGYWVKLMNPTDKKSLEKHLYADSGAGPVESSEISGSPLPLIPESAIAAAVGSAQLQVKSGDGETASITYKDGVFTVSDLKVVESGSDDSIESVQKYEVRAVLSPTVNS